MTELPVTLIQHLHARQVELEAALTTLRAKLDALQQTYIAYTTELQGIEHLLRGYALSEADVACLGAEATGAVLPPPVCPDPAVLALDDAIAALFRAHRPMGLTQLRRLLDETYGLEVAQSSLYDLLRRGRETGHYVKHGQTWALAESPPRAVTP